MADSLNDAQRRAVFADGPIVCCACPGSGKTTVITRKVRHIFDTHPAPRIIMTTFSRDAAEEMLERLEKKAHLTKPEKARLIIGTFHSLALRQLRSVGQVGKIISDIESKHLIMRAMQDSKVNMSIDLAEPAIARCKSDPAYAEENPEEAKLTAAYRTRLDAIGAHDFTDMLIRANALMAAGELPPLQGTHLMADEFQDIDAIQYEWLMHLLTQPNAPVPMAVGDDDQSIYGFRRSLGYKGMMDFVADTGAEVIHLDTNYRSTGGIIEPACRLIAYNLDRVDKQVKVHRGAGPLPDIIVLGKGDKQELALLSHLDKVYGHRPPPIALPGRAPYRFGVKEKEVAVLARTNHSLREIENLFITSGVPYLRTGRSVWDTKLIQVYVALLESLAHRTAMGLEIALRWARVNDKVIRALAEPAEGSLWNYIRPESPFPTPDGVTDIVSSLFHHGRTWSVKLTGKGSAINAPIAIGGAANWMASVLKGACELNEDGLPKPLGEGGREMTEVNRLEAVRDSLLRASGALLQRVRNAQQKNMGEIDRVILSTFHASKGLEWDHVYLVDVHGGVVPKLMEGATEEEVAEERRVFYVAMTRARDRLTIYGRRDKPVSEFLVEAELWNGLEDEQGGAILPCAPTSNSSPVQDSLFT